MSWQIREVFIISYLKFKMNDTLKKLLIRLISSFLFFSTKVLLTYISIAEN